MVTDCCIGVKDLTCIDVCPVDCIYDGGDDDKMVDIDVDACIACVPVCPPDEVFVDLAAAWVADRPAGRDKLEEILSERAT